MSGDIDPYAILDIDRDATPEEIAAAYRDKARRYHPDAGGDAWAFKRVQEAYELLREEHGEGGLHERDPMPQADGNNEAQGMSIRGAVLPLAALVVAGAIVGAVLGAAIALFLGANPFVGVLVGGVPGAIAGGVTAPSRR